MLRCEVHVMCLRFIVHSLRLRKEHNIREFVDKANKNEIQKLEQQAQGLFYFVVKKLCRKKETIAESKQSPLMEMEKLRNIYFNI